MFASVLLLLLLALPEAYAAPDCGPLFSRLRVLGDGARIVATKELRDGDLYLAYNATTYQLRVVNLKTGKSDVFTFEYPFTEWAVHKNGVVFKLQQEGAVEREYFHFLNFKTGESFEYAAAPGSMLPTSHVDRRLSNFTIKNELGSHLPPPQPFDAAGEHLAVVEGNGVRVFKLGTEESRRIELPGSVSNVADIPGQWKQIVSFQNHPPVIVDLASGEVRAILTEQDANQFASLLRVTDDGKKAIFVRSQVNRTTKYAVVDLTTMETKEVSAQVPKEFAISPDGAWVLEQASEDRKHLRLIPTGGGEARVVDAGGNIDPASIQFSPNGKFVYYESILDAPPAGMENARKLTVVDLATSAKKEHVLNYSKLGGANFLRMSDDGKSAFFHLPGVDGPYDTPAPAFLHRWNVTSGTVETVKVPGIVGDTRFLLDGNGKTLTLFPASAQQPRPLARFELNTWSDIAHAGVPALPADEAGLVGALAPVLHPERYKSGLHYPLVKEFFEKGYYRNKPEYILPSLYSVLEESPSMYRALLDQYPDIHTLAKGPIPGWAKMPAKVQKRWANAAQHHIKTRIQFQGANASKLDDWKDFGPLKPLFSKIDEEARGDFAREMASTMTAAAAGIEQLAGVYEQKIFKFIKATTRRFFEVEDKQLTDLTFIRADNALKPVAIATHPIEGGVDTGLGIYAKTFDPISVPVRPAGNDAAIDIAEQSYRWKVGDDEFTATFKASRPERRIAEVAPRTTAPDYASMWRDNKLTGMVMPDDREGADLLSNYLEYYMDSGFKFGKDIPTSDVKAFLENEITSGRLDYFIKEAHSDGSLEYLFRFHSAGAIKKGMKKLPDGKEEIVYLFFPDPAAGRKTQLNVPEFGSWIRRREATQVDPREAPQLAYFNTSCFSANKACAELGAAGSDRLLNISTTKMATTLTNEDTSTLRQLLGAFRDKKNYDEMRQAMRNTPDYVAGYDQYLFPDDPLFDLNIRQKIGDHVNVNIQIKDPAGKRYDFDTQ